MERLDWWLLGINVVLVAVGLAFVSEGLGALSSDNPLFLVELAYGVHPVLLVFLLEGILLTAYRWKKAGGITFRMSGVATLAFGFLALLEWLVNSVVGVRILGRVGEFYFIFPMLVAWPLLICFFASAAIYFYSRSGGGENGGLVVGVHIILGLILPPVLLFGIAASKGFVVPLIVVLAVSYALLWHLTRSLPATLDERKN